MKKEKKVEEERKKFDEQKKEVEWKKAEIQKKDRERRAIDEAKKTEEQKKSQDNKRVSREVLKPVEVRADLDQLLGILRKGDAAKVQDVRKSSPSLEKPVDPVIEPKIIQPREEKKQEEENKIKRVDSIKAIFSGPMKIDTVKSPNLLKPRARSMIIDSPFFDLEKTTVQRPSIGRKDSFKGVS